MRALADYQIPSFTAGASIARHWLATLWTAAPNVPNCLLSAAYRDCQVWAVWAVCTVWAKSIDFVAVAVIASLLEPACCAAGLQSGSEWVASTSTSSSSTDAGLSAGGLLRRLTRRRHCERLRK
jgi:hypothetical protein